MNKYKHASEIVNSERLKMKYSFHSSWEKQDVIEMGVSSGSLSDTYITVIHCRPRKLLLVSPDLSMRKENTVWKFNVTDKGSCSCRNKPSSRFASSTDFALSSQTKS